MKTLEELGISPAPWKATGEHWVEYGDYAEDDMSGAFETFAIPDTEEAPANARLIAAAPDLYQALREACQCLCDGCEHFDFKTGKCTLDRCDIDPAWYDALAKAGGAG